jgi:hypothetical protein
MTDEGELCIAAISAMPRAIPQAQASAIDLYFVMAGLDPAIHALLAFRR